MERGKGGTALFPPRAGRMRNVSIQDRMSIGFLAQYVYDKHCLTARMQIPYARTCHEVFHMYCSGHRKKHVHDTLVSLHFIWTLNWSIYVRLGTNCSHLETETKGRQKTCLIMMLVWDVKRHQGRWDFYTATTVTGANNHRGLELSLI